ncbi:MAG: tetratricopeptide repeat protein, partial [Phycisphaerales bacterium]|nr:tetratricopeptide repeat protein [Phycisphaerales bacterium]
MKSDRNAHASKMRMLVALLGIAGLCRNATAQSNTPPTHAELYARVKDVAIHEATLKSATGAPLTPEQLAELDKAEKSQQRAASLSDEGKFKEAATAAKEAMRVRASILGSSNYLTVSSVALAAVSDQAAAMAPDAQAEYAAADKALRDWNALNEEGHYEQAREKATFALEYAKRRLNESHPMMALAYLRLGTTQIDLGEYSAALESIEKAKTLTRAIFGATHPKYAAVMDRLGWVNIYLAGQGVETKARVETALESLQTAVQIYRSTVGEVGETAES